MAHSKQRYLFIDLLRFIAVVFMVQGHTFDALLDHTLKSGSLFTVYDFFHGFVAPLFLFASGVAFGVSTLKKWNQHIVLGMVLYRRLGKFFSLLVIGYALHLPYFSLRKILTEASPVEISALFQVDALHCIAVTLLFLEVLVFVVKKERLFVTLAGACGIFFVFISPLVWSIQFTKFLPVPLAAYFNAETSSWFPIFPSSAFIFFGVVFASIFIEAKEHRHAMDVMQKTVMYGVLLIAVALGVAVIPIQLYPPHDFWKANPALFAARLGFIGIVTSSIFFFEHSVRITWKLPQILGQESLFIYIVHLIIVYGSVLNRGLKFYYEQNLNIFSATMVFVLLLAALSVITYYWHTFKLQKRTAAYGIQFTLASVLLYLFLSRPW